MTQPPNTKNKNVGRKMVPLPNSSSRFEVLCKRSLPQDINTCRGDASRYITNDANKNSNFRKRIMDKA